MNRPDRLYAIVEELRVAAPGGRSSSWLADRFEVSARTIKRDVAALMEAGVPVVGLEGRSLGYRLLRTTSTNPIAFTSGEAAAVAVALAAEPHLPFAPDGRAALTKLLGAMDERQRAAAERLASRIWLLEPSRKGSR